MAVGIQDLDMDRKFQVMSSITKFAQDIGHFGQE